MLSRRKEYDLRHIRQARIRVGKLYRGVYDEKFRDRAWVPAQQIKIPLFDGVFLFVVLGRACDLRHMRKARIGESADSVLGTSGNVTDEACPSIT